MPIHSLPPSPMDDAYSDAIHQIAAELDVKKQRIMFRQLCENDFWFYCRFATSMREHRIDDTTHRNCGRLWIEEQFLFERCRELQYDSETRVKSKLYTWSRGFYKTTLANCHLSGWEILKDPQLTFCILTWKLDKVGETMLGAGLKREFETNNVIKQHWPDVVWQNPKKEADLWTSEMLNVKRQPGPRESSFSIHGLDSFPTSSHFDRIIYDDCVAQKVVDSTDMQKKCVTALRRSSAIGRGSTIKRYINTRWGDETNDPISIIENSEDNIFTEVSHYSMLEPDDLDVRDKKEFVRLVQSEEVQTVLVSKQQAIEWRTDLGPYEFSCQMLGKSITVGEVFFDLNWAMKYKNSPEQEAIGKNIVIIIDPAGGHEHGDYTSIRVTGMGADKKIYQLDLWRDKLDVIRTCDLLFGWGYGGRDDKKYYGPTEGLVKKWRPSCVWIEEYAEQGWYSKIMERMEDERFRFRLKKLPKLKRSKRSRIGLLQPHYERGDFWYPELGFGHGSKDNDMDVSEQYFKYELKRWSPNEKADNDDCLDSEAWLVQPEVFNKLIKFPTSINRSQPDIDMRSKTTAQIREMQKGGNSYFGGAVSFWGR